jgi:asparagine N-glycosylation enzyme membrane subunit Stt3
MAPFAVAGAWLLRRRRQPLAILLVPLAMVTLTALLTYGSTRFRFAAEPSIVVLAAVAVDALLRRRRGAA